jgi:hypothetical protein
MMKKLALAALFTLLIPFAAEAQQGQAGPPDLPFDTSVFRDATNSREGRIVAKIRLAYVPAEEADKDGELCIALGIEPDPRAILKGYISFLDSHYDDEGKEKRRKINVKLKGKPTKDDGIEFWAECAAQEKPGANDQLKVFIRRPKKEMLDIATPYPEPGQYRWINVTALPNGGLTWGFETTDQDS